MSPRMRAVTSAVTTVTGRTRKRAANDPPSTTPASTRIVTPPEAVSTPVKAEPVSKRRRTNPPPAPGVQPSPTSITPAVATSSGNGNAYEPVLLPATLTFDLPSAMSHLTNHDPRFAQFFTHLPCRPFVHLEAIDPFRTLVTSIIGQQVSWMAARAINGRFRALYGFTDEKEGFPSPQMVEKSEVMVLKGVGLSTRKAEYVISLAQHFTSGQLSTQLLRDGTDEEISKALIAVRGIGQWTVDMFLMFSLRRPDVLAVGDLGVQKGLLRWALSAHGSLPKKTSDGTPKKGKKKQTSTAVQEVVDAKGEGEVDTLVENGRATTPDRKSAQQQVGLPPTPLTPTTSAPPGVHKAVLHTPNMPTDLPNVPLTPHSPSVPTEVVEVPSETLPPPPPAPEEMLYPPTDRERWDAYRAAPLEEGLSVEVLKARLSGKKAKGGMYLTPREMEVLTEGWRPYRSLGVFYMWPAAEEM
ncbi:hypothetical protein CI109_101581 [Kwoniella shandongensis]|uniref:Uncharacterized protein n=1 Tax=Kwoniella shandongensis TaxID=1734106 RepID=A0A5M6C5U5_9TREE|nr:uncharacterized protein CI109_001288 [Kwoniella shandongensis]KAA5530484.1 hypothetical protein CI109_001288 [Kwoniella shandongensis]